MVVEFLASSRVELVATKNPRNKKQSPTKRVIAKARSLPRRPARVPLAERTSVPAAIKTLPNARRRGESTVRMDADFKFGALNFNTRQVDQMAPTIITSAGTPEPTAAMILGSTPNSSRAAGNSPSMISRLVGATMMTPALNALSTVSAFRR